MTTVLQGYLDCALWASTDEHGQPLDGLYDVKDLAPEALQRATKTCEDFEKHKDLWAYASVHKNGDWSVEEQVGHDLWLTRNRHGSGFWDRPEIYGKENAEKLTKLAHDLGEESLVIGDDGLLHLEGA